MKIGIDIGGSHIAVGVVNDEAKLITKEEENILFVDKDEEEIKELIRDRILSLINSLKRKLQIPAFIIGEIGIGVPGIIENNIIKKCEKFGIYDWDLAKELKEEIDVDVKLLNDALAQAKAEAMYGSLKNEEKAVFLCFGTGIGGAIVLSKEPVLAIEPITNVQNLTAVPTSYEILPAEFGHMVIEKNGKKCHCGRKGCFETYCSMRAFKNEMIEILELDKNTTSEELHEILEKEITDERLSTYIDAYIEDLALGISNIINITNPQKICIGGSFVYFKDILYGRLVNKLQNANLQFDLPEIVLATFQNDAGIIGAVL